MTFGVHLLSSTATNVSTTAQCCVRSSSLVTPVFPFLRTSVRSVISAFGGSGANFLSADPGRRHRRRVAPHIQTRLHRRQHTTQSRSFLATMPPVDNVSNVIDEYIADNKVVVFSKSTCPFCTKVKNLLESLNMKYKSVELDQMAEGHSLQNGLLEKTGQKTVPSVFVNGTHIGGCDDTTKAAQDNRLQSLYCAEKNGVTYDYDLIVVGGGSGGLSASKELGKLGKKVACCDFVRPTPIGTTWGLGGTCVNVGCIPKKLMHQAALLGDHFKDATSYGWQVGEAQHNWEKMVEEVQNHIGSLNWGYKVALREKSVTYLNALARFEDAHTLLTKDKRGVEKRITAKDFIIATGGRPRYPDIPGAKEFGITSDDLFSLPKSPGKTLLVGASYISLECGGFLRGMGLDVTIMVRSILLRGFDQQIAQLIGEYMELPGVEGGAEGVNFVRECVPTKLEKTESGRVKVSGRYTREDQTYEDEFDTVIFAIGRDAETRTLGLEQIGVTVAKNGKVIGDASEQSSVPNIYAIGDILDGKPELTPVAIQAGKLLARRLAGVSDELMDYERVPTTVFTPLEYGSCGLAEEDAVEKFGADDIEVYHTNFWPVEWTVTHRPENVCYTKLVAVKSDSERVVGFHYLGPHAGEVTQGYAGMLKLNAKISDFQSLVGIHPTTAESLTTLSITKSSGESAAQSGC